MRPDKNWENLRDGVNPPDRSAALLSALRTIMRPLVKVMVARGVTLPALVDMLKKVFVEVAEEDFGLEGKRSTDSRISILTGVHRKDVRTIRAETATAPGLRPAATAICATVVGRWLGDPEFHNADGAPLALPRQTANANAPSFDGLVARVSKDVRPRTILDELSRLGIVKHHSEQDQVHLLEDAFVPRKGEEELLHFFKMNLHDHAAAASENLLNNQDTPPFLERVVYYSHLTPHSVDQLDAHARVLAINALRELNRTALALQKADATDLQATERFRFGAYFYHESRPPAKTAVNDDITNGDVLPPTSDELSNSE
ncbi:MAG: hypothetical protein KTR21_06310 [Rhodobacteraceae bacterium]|nr:hypothetical protein [Paracoccaceae bacterium]